MRRASLGDIGGGGGSAPSLRRSVRWAIERLGRARERVAALGWSEFDGHADMAPKPRAGSWDDLVRLLSGPPLAINGEPGPDGKLRKSGRIPCWSGATYGENASRVDEEVMALTVLAFDLDEPTDADRLREALRFIGVRAAAHTSYNATPDALRWRVVFALDRPAAPAEYARLWRLVAEWLAARGLQVDAVARNASRLWYCPAAPPERIADFQAFEIEGETLSVDAAAFAPEEPQRRTPTAEKRPKSNLNRLPKDTIAGPIIEARGAAFASSCKVLDDRPNGTRGGGLAAFDAAVFLVRGLGINVHSATAIMLQHYNPRAIDRDGNPWPWDPKELASLVRRAAAASTREPGYALRLDLLEAIRQDLRRAIAAGEYSHRGGLTRTRILDGLAEIAAGIGPAWEGPMIAPASVLAQMTGLPERTINHHLADLREMGSPYFRVTRGPKPTSPARFELTLEAEKLTLEHRLRTSEGATQERGRGGIPLLRHELRRTVLARERVGSIGLGGRAPPGIIGFVLDHQGTKRAEVERIFGCRGVSIALAAEYIAEDTDGRLRLAASPARIRAKLREDARESGAQDEIRRIAAERVERAREAKRRALRAVPRVVSAIRTAGRGLDLGSLADRTGLTRAEAFTAADDARSRGEVIALGSRATGWRWWPSRERNAADQIKTAWREAG